MITRQQRRAEQRRAEQRERKLESGEYPDDLLICVNILRGFDEAKLSFAVDLLSALDIESTDALIASALRSSSRTVLDL